MTRYTDLPEAYPGQHEVIVGRLIEHERDLAVIARIGGAIYRSIDLMPHSRKWDDETYHASAKAGVVQVQNNRKASRRAMLPESAFDWPIYRIAINERRYRDPFDSFGAVEGGIEQYQRESR